MERTKNKLDAMTGVFTASRHNLFRTYPNAPKMMHFYRCKPWKTRRTQPLFIILKTGMVTGPHALPRASSSLAINIFSVREISQPLECLEGTRL